ncbi:uncharacterized protein LOC127751182 [Frankliniella occidentalis]|uniref:Uncharacterized protein LOC127751182 n=1 Tax=Frankliniella occidentalis TaxID=133901 RepID=A0A9C6X707_FRAOC|nr:uncharacterized protein LOC127751182 [Frankliniella occidentalis]
MDQLAQDLEMSDDSSSSSTVSIEMHDAALVEEMNVSRVSCESVHPDPGETVLKAFKNMSKPKPSQSTSSCSSSQGSGSSSGSDSTPTLLWLNESPPESECALVVPAPSSGSSSSSGASSPNPALPCPTNSGASISLNPDTDLDRRSNFLFRWFRGHTICKECVQNPALGRKCPTCRKAFKIRRLEDLPDSFLTIRLLEDEDAPPCKKLKIEDPELQQLQRGADAGRKVVEMLRLVVPLAVESLNRQLESSVAQLGQVEEALERRVQREAAGDVGTTSDAVEEPLQLAEQLEASHRLLTSTKCTVAAEEEGGSSWTGSVQPGGCGDILRVLLAKVGAK